MRKMIWLLALPLLVCGCTDPYGVSVKAGADISTSVAQVLSVGQQLQQSGAISTQEAINIAHWADAADRLDGSFLSCVSAAHVAGSKAAGLVTCANTFATSLSDPTLQAEIRVSNPSSQQKLTTVVLAVQTGVTGVVTALQTLSAQGK